MGEEATEIICEHVHGRERWRAFSPELRATNRADIRAALAEIHRLPWLPTSENVNALPDGVRQYVHDLATRCDHSGELRELIIARDTITSLSKKIEEMEADAAKSFSRLFHLDQWVSNGGYFHGCEDES